VEAEKQASKGSTNGLRTSAIARFATKRKPQIESAKYARRYGPQTRLRNYLKRVQTK